MLLLLYESHQLACMVLLRLVYRADSMARPIWPQEVPRFGWREHGTGVRLLERALIRVAGGVGMGRKEENIMDPEIEREREIIRERPVEREVIRERPVVREREVIRDRDVAVGYPGTGVWTIVAVIVAIILALALVWYVLGSGPLVSGPSGGATRPSAPSIVQPAAPSGGGSSNGGSQQSGGGSGGSTSGQGSGTVSGSGGSGGTSGSGAASGSGSVTRP